MLHFAIRCFCTHLCLFACCAAADERPNILIILTDDQGAATIGCYGGTVVATPHLDKLASEGVRFVNAYATSQCTPTRATLLSGQYTARTKMWHVIGWYGCPWAPVEEARFVEQFPSDAPNTASELRRSGYVTGIVGKWHLTTGRHGGYRGLEPEHAHRYGFDYAAPPLADDAFRPGADRGVSTLTDQAIEFIARDHDAPWFCLVSHHMIHGNVVAPRDLVQKYRQRGFGDDGPNRAVYLAGLECIDRSVGRLMAALDRMHLTQKTVVLFLSDNGGIHERLEHRSLDVPHPAAPKLQPNLREFSNAPLRAGKGSIYEGGVRIPMIVRWPNVAVAKQVIETPVHVVDIAPTLFALANHAPPPAHGLDGVDLTKLLRTGTDPRLERRPLFQYAPFYDLNWGLTPCASIRKGDYKLIEFFGDRFDRYSQYVPGHQIELYDLRTDPGETQNLADAMPAIRTELGQLLHSWMRSCGVEAMRENVHHDPARAFLTTNEKPAWLKASADRGAQQAD